MNYAIFFKTIGLLAVLGLTACNNTGNSDTLSDQTDTEAAVEVDLLDRPIEELDFGQTSQALLSAVRDNEDYQRYADRLANADRAALNAELNTDDKKLAFWANVYNSYIQIVLHENLELWNDRDEFFGKEQVPVAGKNLSFDLIEHGIIRSSTMKISLGYVGKLFPSDFEKEFRLEEIDPRYHFVLNCGAADCPPIYVFNHETLDEDFDQIARAYLQGKSKFYPDENRVETTSLFKWFPGDFGSKDGIQEMLKKYGVVPEEYQDTEVDYLDYDWTKNTGMFGDRGEGLS